MQKQCVTRVLRLQMRLSPAKLSPVTSANDLTEGPLFNMFSHT